MDDVALIEEIQMKQIDMQKKILECEGNVFVEIKKLIERVENAEISAKEADAKRREMSEKLDVIHNKFEYHTEEEMRKYDEIITKLQEATEAINKLAKATADNSSYIASQKFDDELEKRLAQKIIEEQQKSFWKKPLVVNTIKTIVAFVSVGIVSGIGTILWFGFKAWVKLNLGD